MKIILIWRAYFTDTLVKVLLDPKKTLHQYTCCCYMVDLDDILYTDTSAPQIYENRKLQKEGKLSYRMIC